MDLMQILMQSLGNQGVERLGQQVGLDSSQTTLAMGAIVPTLLGAMAKQTSSQEGATGLLGALDKDHDGGILDDIGGFLGGSMSSNRSANGDGILGHILGGQRSDVETGLANKMGVNASSIGSLMKIAAPLIMAYLGKQKRSADTSGFDAGGIGDLLGNLAGGSNQSNGIDLGDIMDMVGGLSGSSSDGSSGGGGILGGLLKGMFRK